MMMMTTTMMTKLCSFMWIMFFASELLFPYMPSETSTSHILATCIPCHDDNYRNKLLTVFWRKLRISMNKHSTAMGAVAFSAHDNDQTFLNMFNYIKY
jgi:hypothetical protein